MSVTAFVGCAHIHTPGFVKRINAREDITVKCAWDPNPARAEKVAADLDGAVVATDLDAIWEDAEIESVIICSETDRHAELAAPAAAAGKHLFIEKPLGMGAADAFQIAGQIDAAGVIFQTGHFMRGQPVHLFLRDQIQQGHFGTITRARHSNCHSGALGGLFDNEWRWMADPSRAGVGAFGDLGAHSLDIMLWLLGDVTQVTAQIETAIDRYEGCDEYGEGLLRFANGVVGTLAAGWVDVANPVTVVISGTEGHAHVANGQLYFKSEHVPGADGQQPWTDLPEMLPHAFDQFFYAVGGQPDAPLVTAQEAAIRCAVMEALYTGARENRWVATLF